MSEPGVENYLASIDDDGRRGDVTALHELIRETLPDLEVGVSGYGGIGYGPFHYRYGSGRESDTFRLSIANRKAAISLYLLCVVDGEYLAARYADRLPKASIGKSCVRIKQLSDIDLSVLRELLREAGDHPPQGAR